MQRKSVSELAELARAAKDEADALSTAAADAGDAATVASAMASVAYGNLAEARAVVAAVRYAIHELERSDDRDRDAVYCLKRLLEDLE